MNQVEQTIFAPPDGNCLAACVASILELPLEAVPNFHEEGWYFKWCDWLAPMNLKWVSFPYQGSEWIPSGYSILGAQSPRFDYLHAVVCFDGQIVWDPHPERHMGVGEWKDWTVFVVLDPSKPILLPKGGDYVEGLTPGRVVHFVVPEGDHLAITGTHLAATVADVNGSTVHGEGTATLQVYDPQWDGTKVRKYVPYSEEQKPGTWHWIERS